MIDRFTFAEGAQRAGRHPKGDGRIAAWSFAMRDSQSAWMA
jgi:hypothetical protein